MNKHRSDINFPDGANFAPQKPLVDLKETKDAKQAERQVQDHWLVKELKRKYEYLINKDKPTWKSLVIAGQINALFIQGEQILRINNYTGNPKIEKPNKSDPLHIKCINKLQQYCTQMQAKWKTSKPDILIEPFSNQDQAVAQARKANAVADYLERQFFNTWFDLQEGLNAQIWGWYGRQVCPDYTSKAFSTFKEILGEKEVSIGKAYGRCDKCGYKGEESKKQKVEKAEFDSCPECESLEYDYEPPIKQIIKTSVGREKVFLPEIICKPLQFASTRWDICKKIEESSWMITEREVEEGAIRRILGSIRFPEGESGNDFGLDVLDYLSKRGAAFNGHSDVAHNQSQKVVLTEMYLSSEDLFDIRIGGDEKTVEGERLPKGKRMSDVFPEGVTVIGINGMSLILGIYKGTHCDSVSSGVFHMKPNSGTGRGIDDAIEVQKQFNRRYSQIDSFMSARGTPPILMPENAIEPRYRQMLSKPNAVIPVKLQNFPEISNIQQLIAPLQGQSVPGDLIHVTFDRLENMMQMAYHIMNFSGGNPRADNKTATGAEILDANADEIVTPILSIKAECSLNTVRKGFYKWCRFNPVARFIPFREKSRTGEYGVEISGRDINAEYNWSYVAGSEAPKNRHTENVKKAGFFSLFRGGVVEYFTVKRQFPKDIAELERDFDVNFKTDNYDAIGESCRLRLERAKELLLDQWNKAQVLASQGIPSQPDYQSIISQVQPKLLPTENHLMEKAGWFAALLDDEIGLTMPPEERDLVSAFIIAFKELSKTQTATLQRDAAEVQMAAQEPMQKEQAAQMMVQNQMQEGREDKQLVAGLLQNLNQNAESESAREHEKEMQNDDHAIQTAGMINEQLLQDKENRNG